jgi:hypothetical protein
VKFHSQKYLVAHVNGCCERTCANIKLWWFSHAQTLFRKISFITVEHGMDHIMEGWITCFWTHNIFQMIWNPTMMAKMSILKVMMMGSWSSISSWPWSKVISLWVAL